jgi:hypothetical protein
MILRALRSRKMSALNEKCTSGMFPESITSVKESYLKSCTFLN